MKFSLILFLTVWFLAGCGSGDSSTQDADELVIDGADNVPSDDANGQDNTSQQGTDPLIQNTTTITFDITVPAYQSNELKIEVLWQEISLVAQWVGDEHWQATGEFPTATEGPLSITFYDKNGALELAVFKQTFQTGINAGETVQVIADQFDRTPFDNDADGTNNLDELLAGSDPLAVEPKILPIRFNYRGEAHGILLPKYEASARGPRPYSFDEVVPLGSYALAPTLVSSTSIAIDEFGNGSRFNKVQYMNSSNIARYHEEQNATRTFSGSSVVWEGSDYLFNVNSEYSRDIHFAVEASRVDSQSMRVEATFELDFLNESRAGDYQNTVYNLVVIASPDPKQCLPDRGTYNVTWGNSSEGETRSTTLTKNAGDEYWHVVTTLNGSTTDEYLTSWIDMKVFCQYADLD